MNIRWYLIGLVTVCSIIVFIIADRPDSKRVIILYDCGEVERIAELYSNVERLYPYLERYGIDTVYGDTLSGCGYILTWGDRAVRIDTIMAYPDLKQACLTFFQIPDEKRP